LLLALAKTVLFGASTCSLKHSNLRLLNDTNLMLLIEFIDVSKLYIFRAFAPIIRSTRPRLEAYSILSYCRWGAGVAAQHPHRTPDLQDGSHTSTHLQ
jgi:hypothetical protein